jgi:2-polyprenyl-3-methyl-5-hydroxy-6-metoxy-1,4-benzoquinol methylase
VNTTTKYDHTSDPNFVSYYAEQSATEATLQRFVRIKNLALRLLSERGKLADQMKILDIGCGAGTQARLWAQSGHLAYGVDVNAPLIEVGQARAKEEGLTVELRVGSAAQLEYADASMDVCLMPELLEHVQDWQSCLNEAVRVLKPGGLLYLSTTNVLCPVQLEFNLPLYSWYPAFAKRHYEHLSVTTRPELANFARYPAVNWFSYYSLRRYLKPMGMTCQDRFEVLDGRGRSITAKLAVSLLKALPPLRAVGQTLVPGSMVWAFKQEKTPES